MKKEPIISNEEGTETKKPLICGIDIGPRHMGLCVVDGSKLDDDGYMPYMEHSTVYINSEGYAYRGWKETNATEMVYRWVHDRWEDVFSKCEFVLIEKQMENHGGRNGIKPKYQSRETIMIEQILKTIFQCYIPLGGPVYRVVGPTWAKNRMEIPCTGNVKDQVELRNIGI